ncbi:ATP-binding protein [Streptomyces sp. NPDC051217]|uniref:ATP-binding protein n=1 Tax=Streptomyces sp. NPDC051217 TaxID=3365644 RepID=UPI003789C484
MGKTRLALQAAEEAAQASRGGGRLIRLGELRDASLLADVVVRGLGVLTPVEGSSEDALVGMLAESDCLLVLDGCEQIVDAVAALCDRLLRECRLLRLVCTSRERLRIAGEALLRVPPLAVPESGASGRTALSDAVTLFAQRAASAVPHFTLTDRNADAVTDICRRLDGLPLAIELAAARLTALSPAQILDRLNDRYQLLTHCRRGAPRRQQTLRLCMDWSFDLCNVLERRVWSRLAFFAGDFDMEAAAAICGPDRILDHLTALEEKSILVREEPDGAVVRFRMLDTLRAYGKLRAREAGCVEEVESRLSDWCADLVDRAAAEFVGPHQVQWIARVNRELPNLLDVLDRQILQDPRRGGKTAAALFPFWSSNGLFADGCYWLDRSFAADPDADRSELTHLIFAACVLTAVQGDTEGARDLAARARTISGDSSDPLASGVAALAEGTAALFGADLDNAHTHLQESLGVLGSSGTPGLLRLSLLTMLGYTHLLRFEDVQARRHFEDALAVTSACGESIFRAYLLWGSAIALWRGGGAEEATARLWESLRVADVVGHPLLAAACLETLAWITAEEPDPQRAATLLGAAEALSGRVRGLPWFLSGLLVHHRKCEHTVQRALGKGAFVLARRAGAELVASGPAAALAHRAVSSAPSRRLPSADVRLSRREGEVAALICRGLTNRLIAQELVISERTVHGHVARILKKLNVSSRVQVATWVVTHPQIPQRRPS